MKKKENLETVEKKKPEVIIEKKRTKVVVEKNQPETVEMKKKSYSELMLSRILIVLVVIAGLLLINISLMVVNTLKLSDLNNVNTNNNNNEEEVTAEYDVSKYTEIKASEIKAKTTGKNTVIYIGRATCGWCVKYLPILNEAISKYDLKPLYIDISKIINYETNSISDQANYDNLSKIETVDKLKDYMKENMGATPMTLIVKDGKLIAAQTGYVEAATLKTFLEANGFKAK